MTLDRVSAIKSVRSDVVSFLHDLSPAEWSQPSRCAGWSIKDVASHMGAAAHGTFTTWVIGMMTSKDIEASNDADVEKRRSWAPEKVLGEYERWSKRFAATQVALQKPALRSIPIKVGEVGTYPAKLLTSAIVFDSGLHLRYDMATALGRDVPAPDGNQLAVTVEWMMAGLATMSGDALSWLDRPVELNLVGPAGSTWGVLPGGAGKVRVTPGTPASPAAVIEGDVSTFPVWGTRREPWRSADLSLKGDEELASRFLDSARII